MEKNSDNHESKASYNDVLGESKSDKDEKDSSDKSDSKSTSKSESSSTSKSERSELIERSEGSKPAKKASFFEHTNSEDTPDVGDQSILDFLAGGKVVSNTEQSESQSDRTSETLDANEASMNPDDPTERPMDNEEVSEVAIELVNARGEEINNELNDAEPDSPEEFEAIAGAAFLESLRERAEGDEPLTPEEVDAALAEAAEDLSLDLEVAGDDVEGVGESVEDHEAPLVAPEGSVDSAESEADPDDPAAVVPPVPPVPLAPTGSPTPPVPAPNNPLPTPGGPNRPPPIYPPTPPGPNSPPPSPDSSQTVVSPFIYNPPSGGGNRRNAAPANPNTRSDDEVYQRRQRRRSLLVGLLVGYVVGRRGGRKRTERKLEPKINNLEKEVTRLHNTVADGEDKIRKMARKAAESKPDSKEKTIQLIERRKVRAEVKQQIEKRKELAENPKVEKVGRFSLPAMNIFREKRLIDGSENDPKRKRVEVMTTTELIDKLGNTKVDGLVLVEMYKKGRISEETMRTLTAEYLRSGSYESTFRRELLPDPAEMDKVRGKISEASQKHEVNHPQPHLVSDFIKDIPFVPANVKALLPDLKSKTSTKQKFTYGISVIVIIVVVAALLILSR
ncbi:MAG: hypothetical protein ACI9T8_000228 [Candidatus Saccharimonadales bacterium]|jgi:hypothetical protein